MADSNSGWGWPMTSRKAHYFGSDGRSLCCKWLFAGQLTPNQRLNEKPGPDDCAVCHKRLTQQEALRLRRPR